MRPMVLLVDVVGSHRTTWKSFLENQNYEVIATEDGPSALRQCLLLQPDLVLLRDTPPELDGFELCQLFKESPFNELIPIVLIRDSSGLADISRGREAGAAEVWGTCSSLEEGLCRMQELLRLNNYINEQVKSVVLSLARSMEARNAVSEGHSERMVEYGVQLAASVGLQEQELQEMEMACRLHDIGKVAIPDSILLKPGPLNLEETQIVRRHPVTGEKICAPLKSLRGILPVIRHHHERMDGSGYPDGLSGKQIPLEARILQIADIYDALTTNRPYRVALSSAQALQILDQEAARGWLDASLVREFRGTRASEAPLRLNRRSMLASYYGVSSAADMAFGSGLASPLHRASHLASRGRRLL